jgi:hypothetical protein
VLGAIVAVPWGPSHDEVSLHEQPSPDGEIAVLVWTSRETLRSEARERIAALAWSGDEPRVLASFEPGGSLRLLNAYAFPRTRGLVGS